MRTPPFSAWAAWHAVSLYSYRKRYTHGRCFCHPPPASESVCFWVSSRFPKADTDRHCRQAWQAEANPFQTAGTSHRTSAGLSAGERLPAASSWYMPNTFRPVTTYAHTLHTDSAFPSATPQSIWYIAQPFRIVADGRLPPALLFLHGGCPVRTRNRSP